MSMMQQRVTLLAGVSVSVLGLAAPAHAATNISPGTSHVDTTAPVSDTLVICAIGSDCTFGVDASGTGSVSASVDNPADGQIFQLGSSTTADAVLGIENEGIAKIAARATATNASGSAFATAVIKGGVVQRASGKDALASFTNSGTIDMHAIANATATAVGSAQAHIQSGLEQSAHVTGGGESTASFVNDGTISITAIANAAGEVGWAVASVEDAIVQNASATGAGVASAALSNTGSIGVHGSAKATGGSFAYANADVYMAVSQNVFAGSGGDATARLSNSGDLTIGAIAQASASGLAFADAQIHGATTSIARPTAGEAGYTMIITNTHGAIHQGVVASGGGDAAASITNSGSIAIDAIAEAKGSEAHAVASMTSAIHQIAYAIGTGATPLGGNAVATMVNDGSISVDALASAHATLGAAFATATNKSGLNQGVAANAGGNATASLTSTGALDIGSIAKAVSTQGSADAFAHQKSGAYQHATAMGGGDATATLSLADVNIHSTAIADGSAAFASAYNKSAAVQDAVSIGGGNASARLENSGTMNIGAIAIATATSGAAIAHASIRPGFYGHDALSQSAAAIGGGNASAMFTNEGKIEIAAIGSANALAGTGLAMNAGGFASAVGEVLGGVNQLAVALGGGEASIAMANSGTITVEGMANASGNAAFARGHVYEGVRQNAQAFGGGDASASLTNSGSFDVIGDAHALGTAGAAAANAVVTGGAVQLATATVNASAALANSGQVLVEALADATAASTANGATGAARATGAVTGGIVQVAFASANASDALTNSGKIFVDALATAAGSSSAFADAFVSGGVMQFVGGGSAHAALTNAGTMAVSAAAVVAGGSYANAGAVVHEAVSQHASASGGAHLSIDNQGTLDVLAGASAKASGVLAIAAASADAMGISQQAIATSRSHSSASASGSDFFHGRHSVLGPVSISLSNEGEIAVGAKATATGDYGGFAQADVEVANQYGAGSAVSVSFGNSGSIAATALAQAKGSQSADAAAFVTGIDQFASAQASSVAGVITAGGSGYVHSISGGVGPAKVSLTNSGSIALLAKAQASDTGAVVAQSRTWAFAGATAIVPTGINQAALGSSASVALTNDGSIKVGASAVAHGLQTAVAHAGAQGIVQAAIAMGSEATYAFTASGSGSVSGGRFFPGDATVSLQNSGTFSVVALANAEAGSTARGQVHVTGVAQVARGLDASASIGNSGTIAVAGSAKGVADASVSNFVAADGLNQIAYGPDAVLASIANSGTIDVSARAVGTAANGKATDVAIAGAIAQDSLAAGESTSSVTNSGKISVIAVAKSTGTAIGFAGAYAEGVGQEPLFGTLDAALDNSGDLVVLAGASAVMTGAAYASARATGVHVDAANVVADVVNSGHLTVAASAVGSGASGSALAFAGGISMFAANHGTSAAAGLVAGTIVNSGQLNVSAKVDDANGGTLGATATGIYLSSTRDNATIVNSGTIDVEAVTAHGGPTNANGIRVVSGGGGDLAQPGDLFTFTNDGGTIIVRQSGDGGKTWHRGMAIDVSEAPNASTINLIGNGLIYGDIAVQAGDRIDVKAGTTYFDGIINPSAVPGTGITGAALDSGLHGVGSLTIGDGGNLVLADPRLTGAPSMYDGPSYALVDSLDVASDGTLTFELQPTSGGLQPVGSYPQVFANTANLDGKLVADVTTANGLFADSYSWQNLIDANVLNGRFAQCALGGPYANSLLLSLGCTYDSQANVDLTLSRVPFDHLAGLNANGVALGTGLDSVYNVGLTGGEAHLFHDLFLFTDQAKYDVALNQLAGSVYANYLNSFPSLGVHENDLTDHATNCEVPALAGSVLECRAQSPVHVWGQLDYQTRKASGDAEAGSTRSKRFSGLLGVDADVGNSAIVGVDAGYLSNNLRDHQFADEAKGDGWQVGGYAVYDPGPFFLKGVTTYSDLNGHSERHVSFAGLAAGATFAANPTGNPDVRMWTLGLHGGARLSMSPSSVITPYLNYDYVSASLAGFTENNGGGAGLTVESSKSDHSFLTGGVKWATALGAVVPELNIGYRYGFGSRYATTGMFIDGDAQNSFDVISAAQKRGTFLAGLSVGGKVGPVDLRIGYEGEFNGDITSHSGNFKLVLPLGGHAAPLPPPPPSVAAPPPPPPPPLAAPAPPAPEAPASVERGERGE